MKLEVSLISLFIFSWSISMNKNSGNSKNFVHRHSTEKKTYFH